jgi:hypothetical protein
MVGVFKQKLYVLADQFRLDLDISNSNTEATPVCKMWIAKRICLQSKKQQHTSLETKIYSCTIKIPFWVLKQIRHSVGLREREKALREILRKKCKLKAFVMLKAGSYYTKIR